MKTLLLALLVVALVACKPTPRAEAPTVAAAPVWQFLTVDMGYLDRSNYLKGITAQWYQIEGKDCYSAESVAAQLSQSGWELVTPQLAGNVSFKRRDTGREITEAIKHSRSRYE